MHSFAFCGWTWRSVCVCVLLYTVLAFTRMCVSGCVNVRLHALSPRRLMSSVPFESAKCIYRSSSQCASVFVELADGKIPFKNSLVTAARKRWTELVGLLAWWLCPLLSIVRARVIDRSNTHTHTNTLKAARSHASAYVCGFGDVVGAHSCIHLISKFKLIATANDNEYLCAMVFLAQIHTVVGWDRETHILTPKYHRPPSKLLQHDFITPSRVHRAYQTHGGRFCLRWYHYTHIHTRSIHT